MLIIMCTATMFSPQSIPPSHPRMTLALHGTYHSPCYQCLDCDMRLVIQDNGSHTLSAINYVLERCPFTIALNASIWIKFLKGNLVSIPNQ